MKYKLLSHISAAIFGLALFTVLSLIYEPGPIQKYSRIVYPPQIRGGESIHITSTIIRNKECTSTIYRTFIDSSGRIVVFAPADQGLIPAGTEKYEAMVVVPQGLEPGPLTYQVKTNFQCNFLQRFIGGTWFIMPDTHLEYLAP